MPEPGVNCVHDCRYGLPFPDGSVRGIFSEHFFEHLDYIDDAPAFLDECRRVMTRDGVLRLVVPDAGRYLHAYAQGGWDGLTTLRPLRDGHVDAYYGTVYETPMEVINAVFRQGVEHKYAYDLETLVCLLERHGFMASQCQFGSSDTSEMVLDSAERASESLYVEARPR